MVSTRGGSVELHGWWSGAGVSASSSPSKINRKLGWEGRQSPNGVLEKGAPAPCAAGEVWERGLSWEGAPAQCLSLRLCAEDSQVTSTLSPLQSPHKGLPPRPPSHHRPPPPQSLEGLRQTHYHRNDYDKSPIKPKMWSESSLDEPYEKVKKRSSHGHSR